MVIGSRVKKAASDRYNPILRKRALYESIQASLIPSPIEPIRNRLGLLSTSIAHRQWALSQTVETFTIITCCTRVSAQWMVEKSAFMMVWIPVWLGWQITPVADQTLCDLV